jgi:hypothetical protein
MKFLASLGFLMLAYGFTQPLYAGDATATPALPDSWNAPSRAISFYTMESGLAVQIDAAKVATLRPAYWEIWEFKKGASPRPELNAPDHWGTLQANNLGDLFKIWEQSQIISIQFNQSCKCDGDGEFVHDNILAYVAFAKDSPEVREVAQILLQRKGAPARISQLWNEWDYWHRKIDDPDEKTSLGRPTNAPERRLVENYIHALHEADRELHQVEYMMVKPTVPTAEIDRSLDLVHLLLKVAESSYRWLHAERNGK